MSVLTRILGDPNQRELKRLQPLVNQINSLEPEYERLSDSDLRAKTAEFRTRLDNGEDLDDLLPEAFAVVREASKRTIGLRHFDVQLIGGIVLHQGKIAEMATGEGKTLVATLPSYLNALTGRGVHIVTVNDYLAKRDRDWMGKIHEFLGLTVGVILTTQPPGGPERKAAYQADITYGTNNEFGFDYLRDNMVADLSHCVQRELHYAIVDEVDNILIDEARTPLIISAPAEESTELYQRFAQLVPLLRAEEDYVIDERQRVVTLTEAGIAKMERLLGIKNLYAEGFQLVRYMENALKAHVLFKRDKDYVVQNGEVIIVDEFTGRLMFGRRYSEGLHQAIEAKERVAVQRENRTLATITFQNYFRLYEKLAGMTGTAYTEAEEFAKIYNLDVVVIPTHKPMIRVDLPDLIYKTEKAKFSAVVEEIKQRHARGQPVLVGTTSVELSEYLSDLLKRQGIPHNVLNAKYHEKEAAIIAQAGRSGAVTIATNMAGRGTDILLGGNPAGFVDQILRERDIDPEFATPEDIQEALAEAKRRCDEDHQRVVAAGGLHIIGTQRHDARRIDNQLRGRAGRQGDPGSSRFYLSLEDELMRRFAADKVAWLMDKVGLEEDVPIESKMVSKFIEQAQSKVEAYNFDIRKHVVEYDDVIAKQREVIYADRRRVLEEEDLHDRIVAMIADEVRSIVLAHCQANLPENWELDELVKTLEQWFKIPDDIFPENLNRLKRDQFADRIVEVALAAYAEKERLVKEAAERIAAPRPGEYYMRQFERHILLQVVDSLWMDHIDALDVLRAGIGLRAMLQIDPLVAFKNEAYAMFEELKAAIQHNVVEYAFRANVAVESTLPPEVFQKMIQAGNMQTNLDEIARASGQAKTAGVAPAQRPSPSNSSPSAPAARQPLATSDQKRPVITASAPSPNGSRKTRATTKIGRNDPCYCGSGLKYKKCHGR
jgi:preprotein translocase subunit SecA